MKYLLLILLFSCSTLKVKKELLEKKINNKLYSLYKKHVDKLIISWGVPDGKITLKNKFKVYTYKNNIKLSLPFYSDQEAWPRKDESFSRPRLLNYKIENNYCLVNIITNKDGEILKSNFRGDLIACDKLIVKI